jgi:dihydroxyacid dehydratase/phosphogluconate dehydratase
MDARASIKGRLPSRQDGSTNVALHLPATADARGIDLVEIFSAEIFLAEIFKKTPCAAGLKPGGRYAAKDMFEIGFAPLRVTTLNVKLTGAERVQHETKWRPRQTNHTSGALVTDPGRAHEKQCYADI